MAAGASTQNDRLNAIAEFRETYNLAPNAEDLIAQQQFAQSAAVRQAALLPIDHDATGDLDMAALASETTVSGSKVSDLGKLKSAAVRGDAISVVIETADGRLIKDVVPGTEDYVAPREPAHLAAQRARVESESNASAEVADLRAEMEQRLAEVVDDFSAQLVAKQAEIEETASEAAADAAEAAEEAEAEAASGNAGTGTGDSSEEKGPSQKKAQPARRASTKSKDK